MPKADYSYIGCLRCGEITLVSETRERECVSCELELDDGRVIEMMDEKQLRNKAMSLFRQGQPMQGRALEALASAIEEATVARKRVYTNTLRIEET